MTLLIQQAKFELYQKQTLNLPHFAIKSQQYWVVVGSNGSGKSAFALALQHKLPLQEGEYRNTFKRVQSFSFEKQREILEATLKNLNNDDTDPDFFGKTARETILNGSMERIFCEQIAEKLGFPYEKMHDFFKRHNRNQRKVASGAGLKRQGRPRKDGEGLPPSVQQLGKLSQLQYELSSWVTDISYIKTGQGTLYLSVIRDLYDNSIVAYKTGTEQNVNLVLSTIKEAKKKEKVTAELQLHSDQGFQYTSHPYFKLTQSYGITPSMSRRGNPYDNALAENFFSILKTECIHRVKLSGYDEARLIISEYINFYNNYRIQTKTKLTPLEKRN